MNDINSSATFFNAYRTKNCCVIVGGQVKDHYMSYYKVNKDVVINRGYVKTQLDQPNYEIRK